jgi:hypothetical protein
MDTQPKYPAVEVELVGADGNAFNILGLVNRALRKGGASNAEVSAFVAEATKGDYNHLLAVVQSWVTVK